jgi:hypothetical protein
MAITRRRRVAAPNASTARRGWRPSLTPRTRERAKATAVYGLAWLVTLSLAGTGAAHYGGDLKSPSDGTGRGTACRAAEAGAGCPRSRERAPRLRLAYGGDNPLAALLKGLLGVGQRSEPRRWRRRPAPPVRSGSASEETRSMPGVDTYRTVCVRLCDGYYWPVSFATIKESFKRDQRICAKSCNSSVALYYYPNPGGEPEDMVSLQGLPYRSLGTAFLYRTTYDANCKCRPHPWEAEAVERHKSYIKPTGVRAASRGARRRRQSGGRRRRSVPTASRSYSSSR